jgi:hypothetical protein
MHRHARQLLIEAHMHNKAEAWADLERQVVEGRSSPYSAARAWVKLPTDWKG